MRTFSQISKPLRTLLAICLLGSAFELVRAGMKGNKGESDIILYKDNLVIRGAEGQGNLVLAGKSHDHHDMGHHQYGGPRNPGGYGGHQHHGDFQGYGHHQGKQDNFILAIIGGDKGKGKGKGKGGMGGKGNKGGMGGMGGMNGKGKGKGGMGMNMNDEDEKEKGEIDWEQLILGGGGGKY